MVLFKIPFFSLPGVFSLESFGEFGLLGAGDFVLLLWAGEEVLLLLGVEEGVEDRADFSFLRVPSSFSSSEPTLSSESRFSSSSEDLFSCLSPLCLVFSGGGELDFEDLECF